MVISYFATQEWKIQTDKVLQQQKNLGEKDKKIFFSDLLDLDWDEYFEAYCTGARVHLLRDPIDNLETALIKWKRYVFLKKKLHSWYIITITVISDYTMLIWLWKCYSMPVWFGLATG